MRVTVYLGLALAAVLALIWLSFNFDPWGRLKHAKAETAVATEQAAGATEAVKQLDHYTNTVTVIRDKADVAVQSVQAAPGASEPVPDGVLAGWRSAIGGLRHGSPAPANPAP